MIVVLIAYDEVIPLEPGVDLIERRWVAVRVPRSREGSAAG